MSKLERTMKVLRVIWPGIVVVLAGACGNGPIPPPPPPPPASWAVGLVMDSLTPASRLYGSPSWGFFIVPLATPLQSRGTLSRDDVGRYALCLRPAVRLGTRQVWYLAVGDTLYSSDSAAYGQAISRLGQGDNSSATFLDSLLHGDFHSTLPGLVILVTPSFDPTQAPASGRGGTAATAVLRQWVWRDGGSTFAEDTAHASLVACGLD